MKPDVSDVLVLLGLAFVTAGLWQIYSPLGLIFLGSVLLVAGITPKGK